ncbi:restriction endonuclease subunit S [Flavobacterium xinjiangense]|uniref:Type I restriction enzyme, S subunit n=1 Tax=Flavobacterium xinjiangense TaxID=178356 RepID=A0A1M7DJQ8_9FLAO|nr:restriction endonuclease subunit S [Flavobacterium xinjiangense]SHL79627.1 type I restriction enzyme, S subunit [Flavobacterium xinjiangense]
MELIVNERIGNNFRIMKELIGNITSIRTGKLDVNAENPNGKYPFFTCSKKHTYIDDYAFEGESILVAGNGDLNVKYYDGKFNAYQRTYVIQPLDSLNGKYLYYFLENYIHKLRDLSIGGVIKYIKLGNLTDAEIPLPPFSTQQKITEVLDTADQLRQYNKQLIEKYDALTQSLFLEMFGDPVRNEKGWDEKRLEDLLDFLTSGSRGWAKYYSNTGDVFLRIQNVGYNKLKLDDLTYIQTPETAEAKRTKVQAGDIIISITADLGRTGVIPENFPKAFINQHLAILRLKENYNPNYVSAFIASKGGQALFQKLDKGGVKSGLNFTDLKSYLIFCPPLSLQNQFAERVQMIETQKQQAQEALTKSEDLFQSLLQRAFKGELV